MFEVPKRITIKKVADSKLRRVFIYITDKNNSNKNISLESRFKKKKSGTLFKMEFMDILIVNKKIKIYLKMAQILFPIS